jgi:hypothetical protein
MPVDGVHQHGHELRGSIEACNGLAEGVQRLGLRVEPLDGCKVGPDRLVHGANAGGLLFGEQPFEGPQGLLKSGHATSMAWNRQPMNPRDIPTVVQEAAADLGRSARERV